jgi:hypothetical protein
VPAEIHLGDKGTVFRVTVQDQDGTPVDLSVASAREFIFRKPDGVIVKKTGTNTGTGADGKMQYITVANDLDQTGTWRVQGRVAIGAGEWHTDQYRFIVHPNLG